jgi:hypothetical protein
MSVENENNVGIRGPVFEIVQTMILEDQTIGSSEVRLDEMNRKTLEIPPVIQEMHLALEAREASKLNMRDLQSRPTVQIPEPDRQALFAYLDRTSK